MQPVSAFRVGSAIHCEFGRSDIMTLQPQIAVLVAECIAEWAEIEATVGVILAVLLEASPNAALAMFRATENRSTQFKMVSAAAEQQIPQSEFDLLEAIFSAHVRPSAKDRDKLAHWCWGYSPQFPDALLLTEPTTKTALQHYALDAPSKPELDAKSIYVIKKPDIERMATRLKAARQSLLALLSMLREKNGTQRAAISSQLSSEHRIAEALRTRAGRQSTQATQP